MNFPSQWTSNPFCGHSQNLYNGENSGINSAGSDMHPLPQDFHFLHWQTEGLENSGQLYQKQNELNLTIAQDSFQSRGNVLGAPPVCHTYGTFSPNLLGPSVLNRRDSETLREGLSAETDVAGGFQHVQRRLAYHNTNKYQTLSGPNVSPRHIPWGYMSFPLAFDRSPSRLQECEPLTVENLVNNLETYRNRCEGWTRDLTSFIDKVTALTSIGLRPENFISFEQNEDYFFFELIAPSLTAEHVASILGNVDASRASNLGISSVPTNETPHLDLLDFTPGPRSPQYVVPSEPQDFDEDGLELPERVPKDQIKGSEHQSPTPLPSQRNHSRGRTRGVSRKLSSHTTRMKDSGHVQDTRQKPIRKRKVTPVTPRISTPINHNESSEPPSTVSKSPRKRERIFNDGSASADPLI